MAIRWDKLTVKSAKAFEQAQRLYPNQKVSVRHVITTSDADVNYKSLSVEDDFVHGPDFETCFEKAKAKVKSIEHRAVQMRQEAADWLAKAAALEGKAQT